MQTTQREAAMTSSKMTWAGRIMSALPVLLLVFCASMKLVGTAAVLQGLTHAGFPERFVRPLGILELICTIIYLIPLTSVIGAILLTGYLGGATVTHLRMGEPVLLPVIV